jgi:hypothetical protein
VKHIPAARRLLLLAALLAPLAARAQPDLSGTWDVTGANETRCTIERAAGTLTVEPGPEPGVFVVQADFFWHVRAKPGCDEPPDDFMLSRMPGVLALRGDEVVIIYRRPDGGPHGPWHYRLDRDATRLRFIPPDTLGSTTFTLLRRLP